MEKTDNEIIVDDLMEYLKTEASRHNMSLEEYLKKTFKKTGIINKN
mgnify:CR=1 FL=1